VEFVDPIIILTQLFFVHSSYSYYIKSEVFARMKSSLVGTGVLILMLSLSLSESISLCVN